MCSVPDKVPKPSAAWLVCRAARAPPGRSPKYKRLIKALAALVALSSLLFSLYFYSSSISTTCNQLISYIPTVVAKNKKQTDTNRSSCDKTIYPVFIHPYQDAAVKREKQRRFSKLCMSTWQLLLLLGLFCQQLLCKNPKFLRLSRPKTHMYMANDAVTINQIG